MLDSMLALELFEAVRYRPRCDTSFMTKPATNAEVYAGLRAEMIALADSLSCAEADLKVPQSPDWSISDVVAHVVGIVDDEQPAHILPQPGVQLVAQLVRLGLGRQLVQPQGPCDPLQQLELGGGVGQHKSDTGRVRRGVAPRVLEGERGLRLQGNARRVWPGEARPGMG